MKAMILVCACVFLASCVNYKEMSAAEVGCLPKDIVIEDAKMGATNHTWVAIC
ncbi:putative lipoprotein [Teredinibacter turnerae T7901]|uniref:Lipoprotein n=3 Tax=Teredinibacter turnerae TaxID=2426 RepID=C5BJF1_TERTT|nr:putative lipoprotein [Teredinibacter turnerae T7901]